MNENWVAHSTGKNKTVFAFICFCSLCLLGLIDYSIGYRISLLIFYVLPIGFATLYVGPIFATFLAILSVVIWKGGDLLSGAPFLGLGIQIWNGTIVISLFVIVIYLLNALNRSLVHLEATVQERTRALHREMEERHRLEREILDLTERERQQFGQELHDVVCQELASGAIAAHLLNRKLLAKDLPEAAHAGEIAQMMDRTLATTRSLARGFFTTGFDTSGLAEALRETARITEERNRISCTVSWQKSLVLSNEDAVIHFFRIAQEAMHNAARHAAASQITVSLERKDLMIELIVEDNGKGITSENRSGKGLGLRIMAYRAGIIGGALKIETPSFGGTRIICVIPAEKNVPSTKQTI